MVCGIWYQIYMNIIILHYYKLHICHHRICHTYTRHMTFCFVYLVYTWQGIYQGYSSLSRWHCYMLDTMKIVSGSSRDLHNSSCQLFHPFFRVLMPCIYTQHIKWAANYWLKYYSEFINCASKHQIAIDISTDLAMDIQKYGNSMFFSC